MTGKDHEVVARAPRVGCIITNTSEWHTASCGRWPVPDTNPCHFFLVVVCRHSYELVVDNSTGYG